MVQTKRLEFVYDVPWEVCILAYENKFWQVPNPDLPDVLGVAFMRFAREGEHITRFARDGRLALGLPAWLMKMAGGPDSITFNSNTTIDREERSLVCVGNNETFRSSILLDETTTFCPHPEDPKNKTLLVLEGRMEILINMLGMAGAVERIISGQYEKTVSAARKNERTKLEEFAKKFVDATPPPTLAERIARGEFTREEIADLGGELVVVSCEGLPESPKRSASASDDAAADCDGAGGGDASTNGHGAGAGAGAACVSGRQQRHARAEHVTLPAAWLLDVAVRPG